VKLNHLDLQVVDVQRAVAFFEEAFGLHLLSNRGSPAIAILSDGEAFTLVLQKKKNAADTYPDGFHLGFHLDDAERVRTFHAKATGMGCHVSDVIENGRGVMVYCRTEDGIVVEVGWQRPRAASGMARLERPGADS
jgi:catechol 2,3-dioxygenase-like lactoylglutathione lyase family enzyme